MHWLRWPWTRQAQPSRQSQTEAPINWVGEYKDPPEMTEVDWEGTAPITVFVDGEFMTLQVYGRYKIGTDITVGKVNTHGAPDRVYERLHVAPGTALVEIRIDTHRGKVAFKALA